ncbi:MAG: hypothetical protein EZS28_018257 [Streblomastix strix]|uniref:Uncharacterized protein n=1 Tax=Streblomastix strix TaxID=222440 RepID=A0A5J4VVM7_9EUKA|nr:MAG: hypothetical protein EZS28_018257 [Streblomastix strix]
MPAKSTPNTDMSNQYNIQNTPRLNDDVQRRLMEKEAYMKQAMTRAKELLEIQDDFSNTSNRFNQFLTEYPLTTFFWIKYAEQAAINKQFELVKEIYERAVSVLPNSPEIWKSYCSWSLQNEKPDDIRQLFIRATVCSGRSSNASPLWALWIQFENEQQDVIQMGLVFAKVLQQPVKEIAKFYHSFIQFAKLAPINALIIDQESFDIKEDNERILCKTNGEGDKMRDDDDIVKYKKDVYEQCALEQSFLVTIWHLLQSLVPLAYYTRFWLILISFIDSEMINEDKYEVLEMNKDIEIEDDQVETQNKHEKDIASHIKAITVQRAEESIGQYKRSLSLLEHACITYPELIEAKVRLAFLEIRAGIKSNLDKTSNNIVEKKMNQKGSKSIMKSNMTKDGEVEQFEKEKESEGGSDITIEKKGYSRLRNIYRGMIDQYYIFKDQQGKESKIQNTPHIIQRQNRITDVEHIISFGIFYVNALLNSKIQQLLIVEALDVIVELEHLFPTNFKLRIFSINAKNLANKLQQLPFIDADDNEAMKENNCIKEQNMNSNEMIDAWSDEESENYSEGRDCQKEISAQMEKDIEYKFKQNKIRRGYASKWPLSKQLSFATLQLRAAIFGQNKMKNFLFQQNSHRRKKETRVITAIHYQQEQIFHSQFPLMVIYNLTMWLKAANIVVEQRRIYGGQIEIDGNFNFIEVT